MLVIPDDLVKEWVKNMEIRLWKPIVFEDDDCVVDLSRFPHKCPTCGSAAYLGASVIECSNSSCKHGSKVV